MFRHKVIPTWNILTKTTFMFKCVPREWCALIVKTLHTLLEAGNPSQELLDELASLFPRRSAAAMGRYE